MIRRGACCWTLLRLSILIYHRLSRVFFPFSFPLPPAAVAEGIFPGCVPDRRGIQYGRSVVKEESNQGAESGRKEPEKGGENEVDRSRYRSETD